MTTVSQTLLLLQACCRAVFLLHAELLPVSSGLLSVNSMIPFVTVAPLPAGIHQSQRHPVETLNVFHSH